MSSVNPCVWRSAHFVYWPPPRRRSSSPEPRSIWRTSPSVADLADVPRQPCEAACLDRLLHRADDPVPGPVRLLGACSRPTPDPPLRRHGTPHRRMDSAATPRRLPMGYRPALPAARSRLHLRQRLHKAGQGPGHPGPALSMPTRQVELRIEESAADQAHLARRWTADPLARWMPREGSQSRSSP